MPRPENPSKTSSKPVIRRATREDVEAFYPGLEMPTLVAWAGEVDGEVLAIGGFARVMGRWYGFCDLSEKARAYKVTIVKTARMIMDEARRQKLKYVYVGVDENESGAARWLDSLGFKTDPKTGYLKRWQG